MLIIILHFFFNGFIGCDLNKEAIEEEMEDDDEHLDDEEDLVTLWVVSDPEEELKEGEGLNLFEVDNSRSKASSSRCS